MNQPADIDKTFIGYEYKKIVVPRDHASLYADCYPSFGWELEDASSNDYVGKTRLTFKRDRTFRNKLEINKLQRQFEEGVGNIVHLESTKGTKANIVAYVVGLIGTAFMAGSVFAVTATMIIACIVLAIPGFVCWGLAYALYRSLYKKRSDEIIPQVDREYDSIYTACEKAHAFAA